MAKNKNRKKPKAVFHPQPSKSPAVAIAPQPTKTPIAVAVTWYDDNPSWRVARLEVVQPYGWHEVEAAKLLEIRQKLANYESMLWRDILKDRDYNHPVRVDKLIPKARERLQQIGLGMLDEIFRLRLTGTERVWGHRVGSVLHIIWWDPNHEISPSVKRHT